MARGNEASTQTTASVSMARSLMAAAEALGIDIDAICNGAGVLRASLDDPEGRIPYGPYMRMWEIAAELAPEPGFGLWVAERVIDAQTFNLVGFAARNSANFAESVLRAVRFTRIFNENALITLELRDDVGIVTDGPKDPTMRWPAVYAEMGMGAFAMFSRKWTAREELPVWATFRHRAPPYAEKYAKIFGPNVKFNQPQNQVAIARDVLDSPLIGADAALSDYLDRQAARLVQNFGGDDPLIVRIRRVVADALPSGAPKVGDVAKTLALSTRTLQRRLGELGTSFDTVLDEVRREIALATLERADTSVGEAAFLVGYTDAKAFRRAVVRWTGKSPRDVQKLPGGRA